ncbi:hypothetical protein [Microbaculum marinum]|uniref:Uncharacterized protein n=1 Tax=Microbaculum marinum TaxID=1764581 RepID=A0AAW9RRP0_9HYPH
MFQKTLIEEANWKIMLRTDGQAQEATLAEVVIRKLFQVAANGSPHALGHVLRTIIDAQSLNQALIRDEVEQGRQIKERLQKRLDQAVHEGADPVWVVPHPDDIVVIEDEGWSVKGPVDEEGLKPIRQTVAMRDVFLLQSTLDERLALASQRDDPALPFAETAGSASLVFAGMLNDSLPERFRKPETEMMGDLMKYRRLTKRELLKLTRGAWSVIKQPKPRGTTIPPWRDVSPRMERLIGIINEVLDRIRDGTLKDDRAVAEKLCEMIERTTRRTCSG